MSWPLGYTTLPGLLDNQGAYANGVSGDSAVVAGEADDSATEHAVYWTSGGGLTDLGTLVGGDFAYAQGTNGDGSVIVGFSNIGAGAANNRGFRWTSGSGMVELQQLPGGGSTGALGVSADGAVVVGQAIAADLTHHAATWDSAGVITDLGLLPGGTTSAQAIAASSDGSVIVGSGDVGTGNDVPFRWTSLGGFQNLGLLPGATSGVANAVSADGSVVVGSVDSGAHAFMWTQGDGLIDLGLLSGGSYSDARGISGDGTIVVGIANNASGQQRAFMWTQGTGMTELPDLAGVDPSSGYYDCHGIAANGLAIVGEAPITGSPVGGNGQWPAFYQWVDPHAAVCQTPTQTIFGSQLTTGVISYWIHDPNAPAGNHAFQFDVNDSAVGPSSNSADIGWGLDDSNNFTLNVVLQNVTLGTLIQFQGSSASAISWPSTCATNVLVSFDLTAASQRLQIYVNDVQISTTIGTPSGDPAPSFTAGQTVAESNWGNDVGAASGYVADLWFGSTASFIDLDTTSNRRKFINADLSPVSLGSNGQTPFGSAPQIYQTMTSSSAPVSDWLTNLGSAGGSFAIQSGDVTNSGDPCISTPVTLTAWVYGLSSTAPQVNRPRVAIYW